MGNGLITRMLLAGASVLALACSAVALAAPSGDAHSTGSGTITGKLKGVGERAASCDKTTDKLAKAKKKLKTLKQNDASSQAIQKAKQKVKKAKDAVNEACGEQAAVYDITGFSASFDATVTGTDWCGAFTKDAHWTDSLAPGTGSAKLEVYYRDNQGRPVFYFSPSDRWAVVSRGSGVATRTCDHPSPGPSGTVSCTFQHEDRYGFDVASNGDTSTAESMTLEWFFGYNGFSYNNSPEVPIGPTCTASGPRPPSVDASDYSPGLFVSPINEGGDDDPLSPVGTTTVPTSTFGEDATLNFSGSYSGSCPEVSSNAHCSDGSSVEAQWQLTLTLRRR